MAYHNMMQTGVDMSTGTISSLFFSQVRDLTLHGGESNVTTRR